jgi:hypothetical protein
LGADCSSSDTKAEWPTLLAIQDSYKDTVRFRYHLFPLPYHTNAFVLAKAAVIVSSFTNASSTLHFFDTAFERQEEIFNGPTADMTYSQVRELIGSWALDGTGLTSEQLDEGWADGDLEMETRWVRGMPLGG